ncbi:MAG TPA: hypothetical protein VGC41_06630 [Kofleriaceae bacterium]
MVESVRAQRRTQARLRRQRGDLWLGISALVASMLALPLAPSSWNGPEVSATLAVAATCFLAGQRWAIALIAIAELLLAPTLAAAAFSDHSIPSFVALLFLVPGLLSMRRAAAALVAITGLSRTRLLCRRMYAAVIAIAVIVVALPLI